ATNNAFKVQNQSNVNATVISLTGNGVLINAISNATGTFNLNSSKISGGNSASTTSGDPNGAVINNNSNNYQIVINTLEFVSSSHSQALQVAYPTAGNSVGFISLVTNTITYDGGLAYISGDPT